MSFWLSCVIWFLLGAFSVVLKLLRQQVDQWTSAPPAAAAAAAAAGKAGAAAAWRQQLLRSGVYTAVYAFDYLLMLVVMTFNLYLFISVCLNLSLCSHTVCGSPIIILMHLLCVSGAG